MALTLRLATYDQGTTYDLYAGTLRLSEGSWETRTPSARMEFKDVGFGSQKTFKGYDRVTETFGLFGDDTVPNLLAAVNAIEAFQERCRRWHEDPCVDVSAWLEFNADGESARRSLIYDLALNYGQMTGASPLLDTARLTGRLAVVRHPLWESVSEDGYLTPTVSCLGGTLAIAPSATCTAPGRIKALHLNGVSGSGPIYRVWAGIRNAYEGFGDFVSVWECELGTMTAGDATHKDTAIGGESGASPSGSSNNKATCTFAGTATADKRLSLKVADVTSHWQDQIGHYLVLCRCKVGAGTTVALQLRKGAAGMADADYEQNGLAYVANTSWQLVELGEAQIPGSGWRGAHANDDIVKSTQLQLWAERVEGAGSLELDCLVLIPTTHFCKIEGAAIQYAGGMVPLTYPATIYTDENDATTALAYLAAGTPAAMLKPTIRDWYLPVGGGLLVVAGERETQQVLADQVYPVMYVHKRWLSYSSE